MLSLLTPHLKALAAWLPGRKIWWILAALALAAQISLEPQRSDDLRVSVLGACPSLSALESGGKVADVLAQWGDTITPAVIQSAAQLARTFAQPQASPALEGTAIAHFHRISEKGDVVVNQAGWGCVVVAVQDLKNPQQEDGKATTVAENAPPQRVYLEAKIIRTAQGGAFALEPVLLKFRAPMQSLFWSTDARSLHFDLRFSQPHAQAPFAAHRIQFDALLPATQKHWSRAQLNQGIPKQTGWMPAPMPYSANAAAPQTPAPGPLPAAAATRALKPAPRASAGQEPPKKTREDLAAPTPPIRRAGLSTPVTVHASLVEYRAASALWSWVADVIQALAPAAAATPSAPALPPPPTKPGSDQQPANR